jgi:predicted permease
VDWLLLRPLPVQNPAQITFLAFVRNGDNFDTQFSYPEFQEVRGQSAGVFSNVAALMFGGLAGAQTGPDGLTVNGITEPVQTVFVTGNFFSMLGIQPHLGRFILPSEGAVAGADPVVVLSYRYWQSRFRADPSIVGRAASINGHPVTIVGVAPKGFLGVTPIFEMQAYLPLGMATVETGNETGFLGDPKARGLTVLARTGSGIRIEQAQSALSIFGQRLFKQFPRTDERDILRVIPLRPPGIINGTNPMPRIAGLFLALAGLVLILACINVANLLLVRVAMRRREMAVRAALGAARLRLIRQLLTESLLLALLGCFGGILAGLAASRALSSVPWQSELPFVLDFQFDWRVFAFAFAVALFTALLVGIVPALRVSRGALGEILHEGGRTSTVGRQRFRSALVAVQVAGSLALLIVAGLFVRNLRSVQHADLGFDPQHVLNFTLDPSEIGYTPVQGQTFYKELLARARSLPGIQSASLASLVPLGETVLGDDIDVPAYQVPKDQPAPSAEYNSVSPGYFQTMGIPLLRGRDLSDADDEDSPRVAVINQAMADRFWPGQSPLGRLFTMSSDSKHSIAVVGVVKNSRMADLYSPIEPLFYRPLAQNYSSVETLQVRATSPPQTTIRAILAISASLAPSMPALGVRTMSEALNGSNGLFFFQIGAALVAVLGSLGLILAVVGVYGVMSFSVSQRTHEIGIRVALGALPRQILWMICRQGLLITAVGLAAGLLAAMGIAQLIRDFLVGVTPTDPLTYAGVSVLLAVTVFVACYIPARRATRVDPMVALRYE